MAGLLIDDVSMRFELPQGGAVQALENVTLDLREGELLSVLGTSGCGKTTLLNIVAGFLAPTQGRIVLGGQSVHGPGPERGMVFQQGALFEWMNVRENVGFGPRMKGMKKAEKARIVDHLLDVVGLADFKDKALRLRSRIATALVYPAMVCLIGLAVSIFLMTYVVPDLLGTLVKEGRDLPAITRGVKACSDFLRHWWWALAGGIAGLIMIVHALLRRPRLKLFAHRAILRVPVLGELIR
ncbi:hypothetical protein LCGC14_2504780, partial [marine sediment metagenome]